MLATALGRTGKMALLTPAKGLLRRNPSLLTDSQLSVLQVCSNSTFRRLLDEAGAMMRGMTERRLGRKLIGIDYKGNKYYVTPVDTKSRMVASTSHVKEIREVEYPW